MFLRTSVLPFTDDQTLCSRLHKREIITIAQISTQPKTPLQITQIILYERRGLSCGRFWILTLTKSYIT